MYFDSFGNLRPPKELEWYLANSIIAHLINVTVKTIADSFVYSFYERLISNLKTDIALFNSVLVWNMSLTLVRWPARAVSYFPAVNLGDGDYELDLTDFETYYTSQCKFDNKFYYGEEIVISERSYKLRDSRFFTTASSRLRFICTVRQHYVLA